MSDVQSCLDQFFKEECVDASFSWEGCTNCGMSSGLPHKFLKITSTPQILCLKLTFFDQHYNLVSHDVQPLEEVDIDGVSFYLQSVICQSGHQKAGHYRTIVRHIAFGESSWWLYDDSIRKRVNGPSWKGSSMQVQRTYIVLFPHNAFAKHYFCS